MELQESILKEAARKLDISPSDFKRAQDRFNAVRSWLENGSYNSGEEPDIYLQGSFRLGTVVRPYRGDKDGDFDIDQVCEIRKPISPNNPATLKNDIGDRLKENADYLRILDDEGKRCWTLKYASDGNRPGFHLDVLPALHSNLDQQHQIDITDKNSANYTWSKSNPRGYYYWFKSRNPISSEEQEVARANIYQENEDIYQHPDDVPKRLVRSNLQRALQLMKRHRDVKFAMMDRKPISIIITTIAAHVFERSDIVEILYDFTSYVLTRFEDFIRYGHLDNDGVLFHEDGNWVIPNPTNAEENFAEKWNTDREFPMEFFSWVSQLHRDLHAFVSSGVLDDFNLRSASAGTGDSYITLMKNKVNEEIDSNLLNSTNFLSLIHLAIDGKINWEEVQQLAQSTFDKAEDEGSKDISKVNFYQIAKHRGKNLSDEAAQDLRQVLKRNQESSAFVMCCNLILGTATPNMIRDCLSQDVLHWPILRLANSEHLFP